MRKNSPRLVAGVLVLGLFAFVGVMVASAFNTTANASTSTQSNVQVSTDAKGDMWQETRGGSSTKP